MPTWSDFQERHVLNPETEPEYRSWNRTQWNDWLRERVNDYGQRHLNSVVAAGPDEILTSFRSPTIRLNQYAWSDQPFTMYVLQKVSYDPRNQYEVYRLGSMYFAVALDSENRPIHFAAQNPTRIEFGQPLRAFNAYTKIN